MNVTDRFGQIIQKSDTIGKRTFYILFGDRLGAAIFLAALLFFALYWRVEFLSTDNYMHVNTLVAASDGHLDIRRFIYGPQSGETPGVHYFNGRVYGDNYGLILSGLPAYFVYTGLASLFELHIVFAGLWSLSLLVLARLVGPLTEQPSKVTLIGVFVAAVAFLANFVVATPLSAFWIPLLALQTTTAVAAALVAVCLYRFVTALYGRRIGSVAGVATFLATPIGFWATVPKRHSVTALFAVITIYAFYRSRTATNRGTETLFRATAYAAVGLCTWVHPAEALVLFTVLVPIDLASARSNSLRQLATVATAFFISLIPFLVVNYAITGDPVQPLRLLPKYQGQQLIPDTGSGTVAAPADSPVSGTPTPSGGATASGGEATPVERAPSHSGDNKPAGRSAPSLGERFHHVLRAVATLFSTTVTTLGEMLVYFFGDIGESLAVVGNLELLTSLFMRSGYQPGLLPAQDRAVNLSFLEAMPLSGIIAAVPAIAFRRLQRQSLGGVIQDVRRGRLGAVRWTDILVVSYTAVLLLFYFRAFPIHHTLTVRFLHTLYPLGIYVLVRIPAVRHVVETHWKLLVRVYVGTVGIAVPMYLLALLRFDAVQGEGVQLYGFVAFVVGSGAGLWALVATCCGDGRHMRSAGAAVIGIAAAAMTTYLLVSGFVLFSVEGEFLLPISRAVADALVEVNPLR